MINWNDPKSMVSKHFSVGEATWLPSWGVHHIPSDSERFEIIKLAVIMDGIREFLGKPINIHVWIRPISVNAPGTIHHGQNYNALVGGAARSAHVLGRGVDWDCGESCDITRSRLVPELAARGIRVENKPGSDWIHVDNMEPHPNRYFIP